MRISTEERAELRKYLDRCKGIAWDTCHKIYVLMDNEQMQQMREYEYDPLISSDQLTTSEMYKTVSKWYNKSCDLRFVEAVHTDRIDPNAGFVSVVPQRW